MKNILWVLLGWVQQRTAVSLRVRKHERGQVLHMKRGPNFGPITGWLLSMFVLMLLAGVAPSCARLPFFISWDDDALPLPEVVPVELPQPDSSYGYSDLRDLPVFEAIDRPQELSAGLNTAESSRLGTSAVRPSASPRVHSNESGAIEQGSAVGNPKNISGVDDRAAGKLEEGDLAGDEPVVRLEEPASEVRMMQPEEPKVTITQPDEPRVTTPRSFAGVREVCGDQLDNDGDGLTDSADSDCPPALGTGTERDREVSGGRELEGSSGR